MKLSDKKYNEGFTLIELLVVIAIIGILSSVVLASVNTAREKARISKAKQEVKQLRLAIEYLVGDTYEWPGHKAVDNIQSGASGNEIWDLSTASAGIVSTDGLHYNWNGPYLHVVPKDPWGNDYFFDTDYDVDAGAGQKWAAVVGSFGPNGVGQNVYDSDDIYDIFVSQ